MFIFVGEKRSKRAIEMNVTWDDGRLAAKTVFEAIEYCEIPLSECKFVNLWSDNDELQIPPIDGIVIGMGKKVQDKLDVLGIEHIKIVHPAARGKIRKHELYMKHVQNQINEYADHIEE